MTALRLRLLKRFQGEGPRSFMTLAFVIVTITLVGASGCTPRIADQLHSVLGTRTENLRDWKREDPQRDRLLMFVHGFNSNKDEAWEQFPTLLMGDEKFDDFNIYRFGYPTKFCRQVGDIRNQGELLASSLTSLFQGTTPKYRQVVLVGHSIGGLVILEALLKLQRDHLTLLKDQDLKVLTFGTPYLGVENTDVLLLFCENKQALDVTVLNAKLGELGREWTQRFNQRGVPGGGESPQVQLYAFYGTEDRFIPKMSACGYPQTPCESVDGDHVSMVKPTDRTHLAYQKLRDLAGKPRIPPTKEGKIGIWVARLAGDDDSHAAQRNIALTLESYLARLEPQLQELVDVRNLPSEMTGNTLGEKEAEAKRIGNNHHASIVVWGDVTGPHIHPRITIVKPMPLPTKTAVLPGTAMYQDPPLSAPPVNASTPAQTIKEPLQLARFLAALIFLEQQDWAKAVNQLEQLISDGLATAVRTADIYWYGSWAQYQLFSVSDALEALQKAGERSEQALGGYKTDQDNNQYALIQHNLGSIYRILAQRGMDPEANLQRSIEVLTEAAHLFQIQQNWAAYASTQNHFGMTYRVVAGRGVDPGANLQRSIEALTEASHLFQIQQNWAAYARNQNNLGLTYRALAERGRDPETLFQHSIKAMTEAAHLYQAQQDWTGYATTQTNLGGTYQILAMRGIEPVGNLRRSIEALIEAARLHKSMQNQAAYARAQSNLGGTYLTLATHGVDQDTNFQRAADILTEAARLYQSQEKWTDYAVAQNNLGVIYRDLAIHGVDPDANLKRGVEALIEASRHNQALQNQAAYADNQNNLGATYLKLAVREVDPETNLQLGIEALNEAGRLYLAQQNWTDYGGTKINLGALYLVLSENGVDPEVNLLRSVEAMATAVRLLKAQQNWDAYAIAQNNLGLNYRALARREVDPEANLQRSVEALTEAARLRKAQQNWPAYADTQNNLAKTFQALANRGVDKETNLKRSVEALADATRVKEAQKK